MIHNEIFDTYRLQERVKEQLKAIHSKKTEEPAPVAVAAEPVVEMTIPVKLSKTVLPTQEEAPLNWKNKTPEREARRVRSRIDEGLSIIHN